MAPTTQDYALLDPDAVSVKQPQYRRTVVMATGFVLMAGSVGFYAGSLYGSQSLSEADLQGVSINSTELALSAYFPDCYGFTGGTCGVEGCNSDRNAVCQDAKCICAGGCTTADGKCTTAHYRKVAERVTFSNKYWPSHWLYMQKHSLLSQMAVSSMPKATFGETQLFDLYELPGLVNGRKQYFLNSFTWHTWVAAVRSTGSLLSGSLSLWGLYAVNLDHSIAPWNPQGITLQICRVKQGGVNEGAVMIGSSGWSGHPIWAYVHSGSSFVYGWEFTADPGAGGYWVPDREIEGLQDC